MSGWCGPTYVAQLMRGKQGSPACSCKYRALSPRSPCPPPHRYFIRLFLPGVEVSPRFPFSASHVVFQTGAKTILRQQVIHRLTRLAKFSSPGTLLSLSAAFRVDGEPSRGQLLVIVNSGQTRAGREV